MQDGGFDVVIGNPPWEVSQLNEQEFFANRAPEIAKLSGANRKQEIAQLETNQPNLWIEYESAVRGYEMRNGFARGSGRFSLSTHGKLNSYALFAETFLSLLNANGRAGLIVPTGIATDHSMRIFFEHIVGHQKLVSLYDFENRKKVFPGIDSRIKFCLLTMSGQESPVAKADFAFFLHRTEQLKGNERRFSLSVEDFTLFNPNTRTCPIFRTRRDMEIARKMYQSSGVLWKEERNGEDEVNPWGISFMQMFNMTSASGIFRTLDELEDDGWELVGNVFVNEDERYLPLYEAKMIHQYDHRFATFKDVSRKDKENGNARQMRVDEKRSPQTVALPRYWVPEKEVIGKLNKTGVDTPLPIFSRAEPSRAEPSRAEPSRAEPSRAEPSRAEPSRAEPSRAEPSRAEPSRAEPSRAEPSRAEPSRAEPSRPIIFDVLIELARYSLSGQG